MLYGNTKKALVQREWQYLQDYADAKSDVVREIFSHMECRTPQEKDACEIMPCVIRPWRTEDAEDIAYAMNNRNVLDNLRDGIPFPYTPSDALEYMSFLAKSGQGQIYSNAASCRILENCGFSLEGILRCNAVKNGTVRDMRAPGIRDIQQFQIQDHPERSLLVLLEMMKVHSVSQNIQLWPSRHCPTQSPSADRPPGQTPYWNMYWNWQNKMHSQHLRKIPPGDGARLLLYHRTGEIPGCRPHLPRRSPQCPGLPRLLPRVPAGRIIDVFKSIQFFKNV